MKKLLFALVMLTLISSISMTATIAQEGHGGHETVESFCHNPTRTITISTKGNEVAFNTTEIKVEKGECVAIMFINSQDAEHDFALNFANGTEYFGLHIVGNGTMQMKMVNALMPNEDTEMPYWCTVEDHKDQGMEGKIIVGAGLQPDDTGAERAPGFEAVPAMIALFSLVTIVYRKKFRN